MSSDDQAYSIRRFQQIQAHTRLPRDTQHVAERLYKEIVNALLCESKEQELALLDELREQSQDARFPGFEGPFECKLFMQQNADDVWHWLYETSRFRSENVLDYLAYQARRHSNHATMPDYADFCKLAVQVAFEIILTRYSLFSPIEWRAEQINAIKERRA